MSKEKDSNWELKLFKRADKGELPICPMCGKGRIHSIGGGKAYSCDQEGCRYQVVMTYINTALH